MLLSDLYYGKTVRRCTLLTLISKLMINSTLTARSRVSNVCVCEQIGGNLEDMNELQTFEQHIAGTAYTTQ
jgi:hypothetical protein